MGLLNRNRRYGIGLLLLLSLFVQGLLPTGFMPGTGKSGARGLVICTGAGPITLADNIAGHEDHDKISKHDRGSHYLCPYASVLAKAMSYVRNILPLSVCNNSACSVDKEISSTAYAIKPWLSQGPPVFS